MATKAAKNKRSIKGKNKGAILPPLLLLLFAGAACTLVPWTVWLSLTMPPSHLDRRWNLAWTGFDIGLLFSFALTAYWGWKRKGWAALAAAATGTFLLIDTWFDCVTASQGDEYLTSLLFAAFAELPMALLAFWVAYRVGRRYFKG